MLFCEGKTCFHTGERKLFFTKDVLMTDADRGELSEIVNLVPRRSLRTRLTASQSAKIMLRDMDDEEIEEHK